LKQFPPFSSEISAVPTLRTDDECKWPGSPVRNTLIMAESANFILPIEGAKTDIQEDIRFHTKGLAKAIDRDVIKPDLGESEVSISRLG